MKTSTAIITLLLIFGLDSFFIISYMHEIFDPKDLLPLFVMTRIGILAVGIYMGRLQKNWLYMISTVGYLIFSFAAVSVLHISYVAMSQHG